MNLSGLSTRSAATPSAPPQGAIAPALPNILWHHKLLFVTCVALCVGAAAAYLYLARPMYPASCQIVDKVPANLTGSDEIAAFLNTERAVLISDPVLESATKMLSEADLRALGGGSDPVAYLRRNVSASIGRKDNVITIELDSPGAQLSARAVNAVVKAFNDVQSAQWRRNSERMLEVVSAERRNCENDISAKSDQIVELKRKAGVLSFDAQDNVVARPLKALEDAWLAAHLESVNAAATYAEAMAQYRGDPARLAELEKVEQSGGIVSNSDLENVSLRAAIADVEQKLVEQAQTSGWQPDHPQMKALQKRLDYLRALYVVATKRRVAVVKEKETLLEKSLKERQDAAREFAQSAAQHARLDAELKRLEKQAEVLDGKIRDIKADQGTETMNIRVLSPARADSSLVKPSWPRVFVLAAVVGLVLGCGAACWREWADHRVRTMEDARAALGLPVLGVIPKVRSRKARRMLPQAVRKMPRSHVAEAYRSIRAAVTFAGTARKCRRILITSASSGEGKSSIAANLGIALAQAGKRVLLVDADLRRPALHRYFELPDRPGLSSVISGDDSAGAAVVRTAVEGLDLLASGPTPSAPADLLVGSRLGETLDAIAGKYDMVLFDCAPAGLVSDARIVAMHCDAVVMVMRAGRTDARLAARTRDGLASTGTRLLGAILNGARGHGKQDYGYFEIPAMAMAAVGGSTEPGASAGSTSGVSQPAGIGRQSDQRG